MSNPILMVPTREQVANLQVGDLAIDAFGKMCTVVKIFARGEDTKGKLFVCYYTQFGEDTGSAMSSSMKEGELVRHAGIRQTSREMDLVEVDMLKKGEACR